MVRNNKKYGFSLVEALVSMLIMSVFFLAATKIMTQKPPKEIERSPHGFFECYVIGSNIYTHSVRGDAEFAESRAPNCNFQIPVGLHFINVHYMSSGRYFNTPETMFERYAEISSPPAVEDQFYKQCFSGAGNPCASMFKSTSTFYNYLQNTNPKSKIYKRWANGTPPSSALFISW